MSKEAKDHYQEGIVQLEPKLNPKTGLDHPASTTNFSKAQKEAKISYVGFSKELTLNQAGGRLAHRRKSTI